MCVCVSFFFFQLEKSIVKRNQQQPPQENQRNLRGNQEIVPIILGHLWTQYLGRYQHVSFVLIPLDRYVLEWGEDKTSILRSLYGT